MNIGKRKARDHAKELTEDSCLGVPDDLWRDLTTEFPFTVDACSTHVNAKLPRHWTREENGLEQCWDNEIIWCHPLFDRSILKWIEKGTEAKNSIIVYLLPASTDTRWFARVWDHETHRARPGCEVRFLPKRLHYKPASRCAAFASCIVVIRNQQSE